MSLHNMDRPDGITTNDPVSENKGHFLTPYLSPAGALAISVGSAIGWGSFVFTGNSYLLKAGPAGSIIGMLIGAVIMLMIGRNYAYMMERYPDAGGVYTFVREVFGYDRAFLVAWFLFLTYISVFWANATSLPLFARNILGDIFKFGPCYTVAGYEVYLGEALLSIAFVVIISLICMNTNRITQVLAIVMAAVFTLGIIVCTLTAVFKRDPSVYPITPAFLEGKSIASQLMSIACMAPWAYVGFENISHSAAEFKFPVKKSFKIMVWSVLITTVLYISVVVLSVTAFPGTYDGWFPYIGDLDSISGLDRYPTFHAVGVYMGAAGIKTLMAALFALIISSLIGMIIALGRLLYVLACDGIVPGTLGTLNDKGIPARAILTITLISVFIPFVGRTAIGWIVDVTTIGTILVYVFISAAVLKTARSRGDRIEEITGILSIVIMLILAVAIQLPNIMVDSSMAKESYFLFTLWGVAGFIFFRGVVNKDSTRRFGNSIIVWIGMLALVLFTALVWMGESTRSAANDAIVEVRAYYAGEAADEVYELSEEDFIKNELSIMNNASARNSLVVLGLFILSTITILSNYRTMRRREKENEEALGAAQDMAYSDQLTGVKSKHAYAEMEARMNTRIRENTVVEFAVLVCDVNGLKKINDTLGHKAGDEHIKEASRMICRLFKHSPVYRIGGDEFVVFMEGEDYEDRQHLMSVLDETADANNLSGGVVIASGISDFAGDIDTSVHQVFERADSLMYIRKKELKRKGMQ